MKIFRLLCLCFIFTIVFCEEIYDHDNVIHENPHVDNEEKITEEKFTKKEKFTGEKFTEEKFTEEQLPEFVMNFESRLILDPYIKYQDDKFWKKEWEEFKNEFKLAFKKSKDELKMSKKFKENIEKINTHNSDSSCTWKMGKNKFSHLSFEEFEAQYCGTKIPENETNSLMVADVILRYNSTTLPPINQKGINNARQNIIGVNNILIGDLPSSVSYLHLMQPVDDQGQCGACWAFAAMAQLGKKIIKLISFKFLSLKFLQRQV